MRVRQLPSLFIFVWLSVGCYPQGSGILETGSGRYEARTWLKDNPNPYAFAGNRFETKQEALDFIERLYSAGAVTVYVTNTHNEDWRIKQEGGPYADTLIVKLPTDPQKRRVIFRINSEEAQKEGFAPDADTGQNELLFWWD